MANKNFRIFQTQEKYEEFIETEGDEVRYPRVDYIKENGKIKRERSTPNFNYETRYLTFRNASGQPWDQLILFIPDMIGTDIVEDVSYSTDKGNTWTTINNVDGEDVQIVIDDCPSNIVMFKGNAKQYGYYDEDDDTNYWSGFRSEQLLDVSGNIMSLFYDDDFVDKTKFPEGSNYNCNFLFSYDYSTWNYYCNVRNAKNLVLPVQELTEGCYASMFEDCENLETAPDLPATALADSCYNYMFGGCRKLKSIPRMQSITELGKWCYSNMFCYCELIETVPDLPATALAEGCYSGMFEGCASLVSLPWNYLPATTLTRNCYAYMFEDCTSLISVPELPATTLADYCYSSMFSGCTSLTTPPELPATTLSRSCYQNMFSGCTSLTAAPELSAITLVNNCYNYMFSGCTRLNYIKALFTTTPSGSYTNNWVYNVATQGTFIQNGSATWWSVGYNSIPDPSWTMQYVGESSAAESARETVLSENLKFTALESGTFTLSLPEKLSASTLNWISYSVDNGDTWVTTKNVDNQGITITTPTISSGNDVLWLGKGYCMSVTFQGSTYTSRFSSTGRFNVSGKLLKLLDITEPGWGNTFFCVFLGCTKLISAENLVISGSSAISCNSCYSRLFENCTSLTTPPTTLPTLTSNAYSCYSRMFYGCTSLTTPPNLSSTTLASSCYNEMFRDCTSLTTAPNLPATTLTSNCYAFMFYGCTSLTTPPNLSSTTLADHCYRDMFRGCTALSTSPSLPATTLRDGCYFEMFYGTNVLPDCTNINFSSSTVVNNGGLRGLFSGTKITDSDLNSILPKDGNNNYCLPVTTLSKLYCYESMFSGCTSLQAAPKLPATTLIDYCYYYMFKNCTSLRIAPELSATTLKAGCYYYMFQGCTSLISAPELPATTLVSNCYNSMFYGCTSLKYISASFTTTPSSSYTSSWVGNVPSGGTFVKNPNASWSTAGVNGIPSGWAAANKVEYLCSTGTQYIDTGMNPTTNNFECEIKADITQLNGEYDTLLGSYAGNNVYGVALAIQNNTNNPYIQFGGSSSYKTLSINPIGLHIYKTSCKSGTLKIDVDGSSGTTTFSGSVPSMSMYLFARHTQSGVGSFTTCRLYYCKIWDNGVLVHDFIPIIYSGTGYLCDRVSGQRYGNSGSGAFTLGPDII